MYQQEDKQLREQFAVAVHYGTVIENEYVWEYSQEEANQIIIDRGFDIV